NRTRRGRAGGRGATSRLTAAAQVRAHRNIDGNRPAGHIPPMDRRRFLQSSTAAAAAGLVFPRLAGAHASSRTYATRPPLQRIGLQLYTVRSLMSESVERTLETVAEIGYDEVEFAGLFGRTPAQVRETLDRVGLTAPATHHGIEVFRDGFEQAAEDATTLGHRYLVLPSLPQGELASTGGTRRIADEMNTFGERCVAAGLRFGFHNHAAELQLVDGDIPLQVFLQHTDPDLVTFEVDLFWMVDGGANPLEYFDAYPGRFELCHIKDRTPDGKMVDVGKGVIDFAAILAEADRAGLQHFFVEHDAPGDAARSIAASYSHLARLEIPL
ncbi:MAG: sugar phosphate isomerase/epimerase family protein, partial [Gemmatimonadota bacterium]